MFKIGLEWTSNGAAIIKTLGYSGFDGDERDLGKAVIAYINKTGGVAGRRAEAAYHDIDATESPSNESQRACTQWTQDDKISFAIPSTRSAKPGRWFGASSIWSGKWPGFSPGHECVQRQSAL